MRTVRHMAIVLLGIMACFCAAYFGLALYYRGGFALNTWINGVYCTGKDVETVNQELLAQTRMTEFLILYGRSEEDGTLPEWMLDLEPLEISVDYTDSLRQYLEEQNPFLWIDNVTFHREHTVEPTIQYGEAELDEILEGLFEGLEEEPVCSLEYSGTDGYSLQYNLDGRLDTEAAVQTVRDAIKAIAMAQTDADENMDSVQWISDQKIATLDLRAAGCFYDLEPTDEQQEALTLWEKLETYQLTGPVYDLGDGDWQVPASEMVGLLVTDETTGLAVTDADGRLQVRETDVTALVEALAAEHDTYGKTWEFVNTAGETITVEGDTYGTEMDQEAEIAWLEGYLTRQSGVVIVDDEGETIQTSDGTEQAATNDQDGQIGETITDGTADAPHIPTYTREAFCRSCTSIGDTYIEVDMGRQKLYYYQEGELLIDTDVVTGNMRLGRGTPDGVDYVYNKETDRVLRGENYASPVDYWMPVKSAVGIHDANWRSEFGGDIYLTNGSHGCINVPTEVMPELYELVEVGTPVVLFYGAD